MSSAASRSAATARSARYSPLRIVPAEDIWELMMTPILEFLRAVAEGRDAII